jgi:hypothetical protein
LMFLHKAFGNNNILILYVGIVWIITFNRIPSLLEIKIK